MSVNLKIFRLAIVLATAGCVHYQPDPLRPEQTAARYDARRLDDAGLRSFITANSRNPAVGWPHAPWDLNSLTLAAFYFHPDLAVARAQWQLAEAGVVTAGARPNPSVSFSPAYDTQIPNNPSPWILPVTLDIPIETAGKRAKRIAEAEKSAESARYNFIASAWQIRRDVRASLLDFSLARRRAELLQQQFAVQTNILQHMRGQFEAGAVTRPELTIAQIALHRTELEFSQAQSRQSDARSHLAQALGVGLAALDGIDFEFDFSAPGTWDVTVSEARTVALRQRADVLGALADYAAAEAGLQLEIARQYPDLHLGPGYAWNNGNANDNQWSLGATVELPILDQNQGPIAHAQAQRRLSAAKFVALQAQVSAQIDRAVAAMRVAREQLATSGSLLEAELRLEKSAEAQMNLGAGGRVDLLNAQLESASARLIELDNEERLQVALASLEDALQQPSDTLAAVIQKISTETKNEKEAK